MKMLEQGPILVAKMMPQTYVATIQYLPYVSLE